MILLSLLYGWWKTSIFNGQNQSSMSKLSWWILKLIYCTKIWIAEQLCSQCRRKLKIFEGATTNGPWKLWGASTLLCIDFLKLWGGASAPLAPPVPAALHCVHILSPTRGVRYAKEVSVIAHLSPKPRHPQSRSPARSPSRDSATSRKRSSK